jgi:branched-chain amino acid aminotransferase
VNQSAGVPRSPKFAWLNGEIVPWANCVVHARSQGAFWGANVFEGVCGFWQPSERQLYLFRVPDHLARMTRGTRLLQLPVKYSTAEIVLALQTLIAANDFMQNIHICITAYFDVADDFDALGYTPNSGLHITAMGLPDGTSENVGIAVGTSSWRRISDDVMPARLKTGANYHNSRLAHHEALRNGYDTALILNQRGTVAETAGSCVVMVHEGVLATPATTSGVVDGITVSTIEYLAQAVGWHLQRREIDRTELYQADEVFLCGTRKGVVSVASLDGLVIGTGEPGPFTKQLAQDYLRLMNGQGDRPEWLLKGYSS